MSTITASQLRALGFDTAANEVNRQVQLSSKLTVAYEHFRFVTPENIAAFQERLKVGSMKETGKNQWGTITEHKTLKFTALKDYPNVPPVESLSALEEAIKIGCFDTFEIASIHWVKQVPDPILFGLITGCEDRFFIAQWDDDVKIEDILQGDEGWVKGSKP